jgi:Rrf2 family protein
MLVINKQTDYAILFISNLRQKKDFVPLSEIVEKTKLPQRFLARIAAQLVKNQIITSREGKVGGYKLSINLNKLSLYDFLRFLKKKQLSVGVWTITMIVGMKKFVIIITF